MSCKNIKNTITLVNLTMLYADQVISSSPIAVFSGFFL